MEEIFTIESFYEFLCEEQVGEEPLAIALRYLTSLQEPQKIVDTIDTDVTGTWNE